MGQDQFETEPEDFKPPTRGRYVFRRPLAEGGLGVVSLCYDTDLNREVAVKEIRTELADEPVQRNNFCAEAEVTGSLEHPGVVPIYSMGTEADGRPYYAMQLISGNELRDHIVQFHNDVQKGKESFIGPRLRQLLRRLIDVCNVIHYAHSRGVIHRDLKTINVMLGRYGETMVIDWGLAKTTGSSEVEPIAAEVAKTGNDSYHERPVSVSESNARHTQQGSAMGTIAYAPPEQLNGQTREIDARSDVYSIGAMLYEVLVGNPPCKGKGLTEALRAIESGQIPPPNEVNTQTPKPLSAIACKAISSSKQDRYQSAKELRNDLQHWLDDQPVMAYGESRLERLYRWKRQHETFVRWALVSMVVVTLVSFFAVYRVNAARKQQQQARSEATKLYQLAREATDSLLTRTSDRLREIPDATDVRESLLADAVNLYERMSAVRSDDPELRRESARVAIGLADVHRQLEKPQQAIDALRAARATLQALDSVDDRILLARTLIEESRIHGKSDNESANAAISRAIAMTRALTDGGKVPHSAQLAYGEALIQRGIVESDRGDNPVDTFESAVTTLKMLKDRVIDTPLERDVRLQLTRAYNNEAVEKPADKLNDASIRVAFAAALAEGKWLVERYPGDPSVAKEHADALSNYGNYLLVDVQDFEEAESVFQESVKYFAELARTHGEIPEYRERLVLALTGLGNVSADRGEYEKMVERYEEAVREADTLLGINSNRFSFLRAAIQVKATLGASLAEQNPERARSILASAVSLLPKSGLDELRDYAESELLSLNNTSLDRDTLVGLVDRMKIYVEATTQLQSALANYNSACEILKCCQTLLDENPDAEISRYIDDALQRLTVAIRRQRGIWEHSLNDGDLELLRKQRPDAIPSLKPQP